MGEAAPNRMSYKTYLTGTHLAQPVRASTANHLVAHGYPGFHPTHRGYGYGYPDHFGAPHVDEMREARQAEEARVQEMQSQHEQFVESEKKKAEEYSAAEKASYEAFVESRRKAVEDPAYCGPAYSNAINYGSYASYGYGYPGFHNHRAHAHGCTDVGNYGYDGYGASPAERIKTRNGRSYWY